jgi:hypothetical protein
MMVKKLAICLLVVCVMMSASAAYAFEGSSWTKAGSKSEQSRAKMEFGLKNMFLGWTELIQEPYQAYKGTSGENVFVGLFDGVFNAVLDTAGGILHFATFPCNKIDIPLPEGGTDIT